jgi:hypothetical protein
LKTIAISAVLLLAPAAGHAALLNAQTVRLTYEFPNQGQVWNNNTHDLLVGPGFEINNFPVGDPRTNVDFSDTNIYITYNSSSSWTATSFNGFHVHDLNGTIPAFTGVSLNPATTANMLGLALTFDADNIWVNWAGIGFDTNTIVSIDINGSSEIPEPGTLGLLGAGLGLLALAGRLRKA